MRKYAKKNAKMCNKYAVYVGSAFCIVYIQNMDRGLVIQASVCADAISRAAPAGAAEPEVQLLSLRLRPPRQLAEKQQPNCRLDQYYLKGPTAAVPVSSGHGHRDS